MPGRLVPIARKQTEKLSREVQSELKDPGVSSARIWHPLCRNTSNYSSSSFGDAGSSGDSSSSSLKHEPPRRGARPLLAGVNNFDFFTGNTNLQP